MIMTRKKLPTIQIDDEGTFTIEIAKDCFIRWWLERIPGHEGHEHYCVAVDLPQDTHRREVEKGTIFCRHTLH
jgi:hypothetical protein